jgi:hypothetical protein
MEDGRDVIQYDLRNGEFDMFMAHKSISDRKPMARLCETARQNPSYAGMISLTATGLLTTGAGILTWFISGVTQDVVLSDASNTMTNVGVVAFGLGVAALVVRACCMPGTPQATQPALDETVVEVEMSKRRIDTFPFLQSHDSEATSLTQSLEHAHLTGASHADQELAISNNHDSLDADILPSV